MENTPSPKCPRCKCYWKPDETDIKSSGLVCKCCKKCREYGKKKSKKYYEDNLDKIKENHKKWRENNVDKIKEYHKIYNNKYYENNANKYKEQKKIYYKENANKIKANMKKIREENAEKIAEQRKKSYKKNANKYKEKKKIYYKENAKKISEKNKKYYEDNVNKIKEKNKKYYEDNADKVKENHKKWRENNKCEHNKDYRNCKICNIQLYLINLQRKQLRKCLKNSNLQKTKPSISYLDCSVEYFIEYFQKKMNNWNETNEVKMNWGNIHIDHIKPVTAFNLDDENEFLDCCHYTNMQPLLVKDNLSKSCKWSDENDLYWCNNIINKEYFDIYIC